jgi:hypothetical protein
MCQENRDIDNPSNFHIYTFFWNAFNVRTYLDDKKQAVYSRHQFSRDNRIGAWPQELENNKVYNIRKKYSRYPMRINFSNNVYCSLDNKHLDAKYEVDYIAIYKKYPCAKDELFDQDSDLKIKDGVYNVAIAKKAIFNFPIGASNPIPPNQMFKLIANDVVDITNMSVGVWSNLIIEPTNEDLCANQLPEIGDGPEPPPNVNMNNNSLNLKTLDLSRLETIVNKKVPYHRQVGKKLEIINLDVYDQFFIFDAQGRLVYSINRNDNVNKVILDLSNYTNGVYYVQGIDSTRRKDKISFPIYLNND